MPIDVPEVDKFGSTADRKIEVWSSERFLACVDLIAKVDLPVEAAWRLFTHEDNSKVFSSILVRCQSGRMSSYELGDLCEAVLHAKPLPDHLGPTSPVRTAACNTRACSGEPSHSHCDVTVVISHECAADRQTDVPKEQPFREAVRR